MATSDIFASVGFFVLGALWFMLPAYAANIMPPLLKKIPILRTPVDFGAKLKKKPLFGKNKTWRGLIGGTLTGMLVFWIQQQMYALSFIHKVSLIDYSQQTIMLGLLLGLGALVGDLTESTIKRQVNVAPGKPWIPWDQLDFVLGALVFSLIVIKFYALLWLVILVLSPILHVITNRIGYLTRFQKNKY